MCYQSVIVFVHQINVRLLRFPELFTYHTKSLKQTWILFVDTKLMHP